MSDLPHSLWLMGIKTPVKQHNNQSFWDKDINAYGVWRRDEREIEISIDRNPVIVAETFLHELLHAAFDDANLHGDIEHEERIVGGMSKALFMYFMDNPEILEYFISVQKNSK